MPIRDARIAKCGACEKRFDTNFAERMVVRQRQHADEQLHLFGPCAFLERRFYELGAWQTLYDTPWENAGREVYFHSADCEQAYMHSDSFGYQWCLGCERDVCVQNPGNGWHGQFKSYDQELFCLRCYEGLILEHGQPREEFLGNRIMGGMFFSGGNPEPRNAGFEEVEGFGNYFVKDLEAAKRYNVRARDLIDSGHKVVTGYERMALGGLEGYVTMFTQKLTMKKE